MSDQDKPNDDELQELLLDPRVRAVMEEKRRTALIAEAVKSATRPDGTFDTKAYVAELWARDPKGMAVTLAVCKQMAKGEEEAAAGLGPPVLSPAELLGAMKV